MDTVYNLYTTPPRLVWYFYTTQAQGLIGDGFIQWTFLDASTHLYMRVCLSVGPWSVDPWSVRNAFFF